MIVNGVALVEHVAQHFGTGDGQAQRAIGADAKPIEDELLKM